MEAEIRKRLTCRSGPNLVTLGSEETNACSHCLIALWSSFRWPYLGSLIKPERKQGRFLPS